MNELGPEARAILEAGRHGDDPTSADRARVRGAVMHAIAAGGVGAAAAAVAGKTAAASMAPKAAAAAAATSFGMSFAGKLVAVAFLASVTTGGLYAWSRRAATPAPAAPPAPAAIEAAASPKSNAPAPALAPAPTNDAPASEPPAEAAKPPAPEVTSPPPRSAPTTAAAAAPAPDPLEAEARRLRAAHDAIQAGDAQSALADLDAQNRAYATGQLGEERSATRVLALCKLGRVTEAKAAAARFIADHPRSPLVDRLRTPCAEGN